MTKIKFEPAWYEPWLKPLPEIGMTYLAIATALGDIAAGFVFPITLVIILIAAGSMLFWYYRLPQDLKMLVAASVIKEFHPRFFWSRNLINALYLVSICFLAYYQNYWLAAGVLLLWFFMKTQRSLMLDSLRVIMDTYYPPTDASKP